LEEELRQPISAQSTCGGSHRLFALSFALERRRQEGLPLDGAWAVAARRVEAYQARAFQMQHDDGSFSTDWFDQNSTYGDYNRRLTTSGHLVEWLSFSLPEAKLRQPAFQKGLAYVTDLLEQQHGTIQDWGAVTHALHGLSIYEQRMLGAQPGERRALALTAQR
jgi:hypothetical protein